MKKIFMILAAITLLTMSLNAQLLPAKNLGDFSFNPTGVAYKYMPNGQFRMPSLGTGEYLLGPYNTDDFDATGISYGGYYSSDQSVAVMVELTRDEFESHIGDTIIGFRFALAGSTPTAVFDFLAWPASENYWDADHRHTWELGQLMSGNTANGDDVTTTSTDVTFNQASDYGSTSVTKSGVTISTTNGNLASSYNQYRLYSGSTTTFSTSSGTITKIVFTPSSGYSTSNILTPTTGAISGNTWTGNASSVNFTASSQYRCTNIVVTVETTTGSHTVEVGRGATKYEHLPVSGWNMDYGFQNQMIYRAGQLAMASGAQITSVTFYPEEGIGIPFSGAPVIVRLANVTNDNFGTGTTGTKITSGLTTVATITPVADSEATAWKIDFTTPFTYTGGNLLVQMSCTGGGNFAHAYFLGDDQSANVSLISTGASANQSTTGNTSTFLPKATFAFTGDVNTPTYLTLAGGEWHDFFLDEPVVLELGDTIQMLAIGYEYYQYTGTSHAPTAVNSNSTGHQHRSYMATDSYSARWWNDGVSGPDNTDRPGDLAVQLIFKSAMQKTDAPTITYSSDAGTYYITATAPATDPNAVVTLTVNGTTVSGTGSVQIPIGRADEDYSVTASATAQAEGKLVSDPTTQTILIEASLLEPTPTPSISSQVLDLSVQVTGSGEGDVHMYIDGQEVNNPYYLERGTDDYYVTVTVTAQINDTQHAMSTTTQQVLVPKLTNLEELIAGWTELPGTYGNNSVINWNDNLMFVDRFTASTADNQHAPKYIYKMTENDTKLDGNLRSTNEHIIPVMKTGSMMNGFYTQDQLDQDSTRALTMSIMNVDAELYLEHSSDIYYYTLDRSVNSYNDEDYIELSRMQRNLNNTYTEMGDYYPYGATVNYGEINRLDTVTEIFDDGVYNVDFLTYVPIVWTLGNDPSNKRLNWDNDHKHNSYGSPRWQNGVGDCNILEVHAERQTGKYGSTNFVDNNGDSCSVFMLDVLKAVGALPANANINYKPYMFRVFVVSESGQLRGYRWRPEPGVDPDNTGTPGSGAEYDPDQSHYVWCVWDEPTDGFEFQKTKSDTWADNMIFAALDNISDLQVFVRYYYLVDGDNSTIIDPSNLRAPKRGDGSGMGAESPGSSPGISTGIIEKWYDLNHGEIVSVTYYNAQGMKSNKPFDGINIIVTRYSDGTSSTTKVMH
ncbi:MAG: hypothetical protein IJG42_06610 [Muribaculaceae bacterium]|nr:hypothetical protein [Muribaculaceae bacterium]